MNKYKEIEIKSKKLESVICDVCKKEYSVGIFNDELEIQEFFDISVNCGYSSVFGDGNKLEANICQHCAKEILGKYLREV